jgi:hypothetical protein
VSPGAEFISRVGVAEVLVVCTCHALHFVGSEVRRRLCNLSFVNNRGFRSQFLSSLTYIPLVCISDILESLHLPLFTVYIQLQTCFPFPAYPLSQEHRNDISMFAYYNKRTGRFHRPLKAHLPLLTSLLFPLLFSIFLVIGRCLDIGY